MRTASWILLTILGTLTLAASLASVGVAYFQDDDPIGPTEGATQLSAIGEAHPNVVIPLRARRGTAAAYGAGYAALFLLIATGPYRRGDTWSWWAILIGTIVSCSIIFMRVPTIGTQLGVGTATISMIVVVVALLLDVKRLKGVNGGRHFNLRRLETSHRRVSGPSHCRQP